MSSRVGFRPRCNTAQRPEDQAPVVHPGTGRRRVPVLPGPGPHRARGAAERARGRS